MLYSGFMDGMINKWNCGTLQCLATVKGHSSAMTSLTVGVSFWCQVHWIAQEGGLEVRFTHKKEKGVLAIGGMNIPVMSNKDNRHDICFARETTILSVYTNYQRKYL
ncbi:hypothetical protein TIFTF001_045595 [Ficus carica]|uniref:Uncharacterized protein n=1 Tax=Ficus carica TaxID=3494 RepID=A0AA87Z5N5_FICCA|nr:hypothetical protein TIFTF001_045595 [Ficus carica]